MVNLIAENHVVKQLRGVASKLSSNHELQKDMMQEMLEHLNRIQYLRPRRTNSWYIKSCEFHVRNHLKVGRSIDSLKRAGNGVPLHPLGDGRLMEEGVQPVDPCDLQAEVITNDIIALLVLQLTETQKEILVLLMKGLGVRETARELGVSHPAVLKHRKKIARIAKLIIGDSGLNGRTAA
jgi:DNA-directed RNA polymerase specialized sigma24 family protein